jgi:hypothetical protein
MPERFSDFVSRISFGERKTTVKNNVGNNVGNNDTFLSELKKKDSVIAAINAQYYVNPEIFGVDDLQNVPLEPFFYNTNDANGTDNPLKQLYMDLLHLQKNPQLMRFLHYGDEQIENDRITKTFRQLLKRAFGGNGNGIIPIFQNGSHGMLTVKISNNWSVMSMQKNQRRGNYGLCNTYLYPPAINALIAVKNVEQGTVEIDGLTLPNSQNFFLEALLHEDVWLENDLRVMALTGAAGGKTTGSEESGQQLGSPTKQGNSYGLQHCVWKLPYNTTGVNISLTLLKNRNIYALSINGEEGIVVDNLSQRGSTGNIFFKNNRRFLIDNYALMNVRLIIYQFEPTSDFYKTMLMQELGYLRITAPDIPVIVIGNSEITREIVIENGYIYWNLQKGISDELTGKMLYKAFITDYKNFVIQERERKKNEYVFIY